jgi:hypothetical protein
MLGDALQGSRREIIARLSCNRNATGLIGMLELTVADTGCHQEPTPLLQAFDHLADFHVIPITRRLLMVRGEQAIAQP